MGKFLIIILLACSQVFAQDVPVKDKHSFGVQLLMSNQKGSSVSRSQSEEDQGQVYTYSTELKSKNATATNVRLDYLYRLDSPFAFSLGYARQGETEVDAQVINSAWNGYKKTLEDKFEYSSIAFGAAFYYDGVVTAGFGIDRKREKCTIGGLGDVSFNRNWMRLMVGKHFTCLGQKAYVGGEYTAPLKKSKLGENFTTKDVVECFAPESQFGLALGVYF